MTILDLLFKEWGRNNPEQASAMTNAIGIIMATLTEAEQQLCPIIEVVWPELTAAKFKKRYEETEVAIQIDEAARLAFLILAHRIPYTGAEPRDSLNKSAAMRRSMVAAAGAGRSEN